MVSELLPWSRNDWHETTWGELVELKYGKALQGYKEATTGFPVYGTNGAVGFNDKPLCAHPGVIIGRKGAYRGVHYSSVPFFVIDTAFYIEPRFDINLKWAYYELLQQDINGLDSGSAIPSTRREDFYALRVKIPPRYVQDKICVLLDSLNNKINCNRQINQTLEQMAQALFKSWFVDFDPIVDNALDAGFFEQGLDLPDELLRRAEARRAVREHGDFKPLPKATRQLFPAAFEECAEPSVGLGGWVPKGWTVQTCEEISDKIGMGPFGSNIKVSTFVEDGVPVISGTHLKQVLLEEHDYNYITEEHALKLKNSCVYKGDIVFTHAGNIGQVSLIPLESQYDKYMISQRQFYLRPNHRKIKSSYLVYFFHSADGQHKLLSNASQTGVPSIARPSTHLKSIYLLVPHMDVQDVFDTYIAAWNKKIMKSRENIISLTRLRDTLLPKLISGELRLDNIEAELAKVEVA
ncbi:MULTISPECIES: restriction endonuclease subunit S [Aeromonas]|uniref:restriction endonuclease subunit S n=1 Tax=Aeromonas TaxID=642 RepID=UPI002B488C4E|nr:restriction endonuclease subunit S [Aeromonas dhakensis]